MLAGILSGLGALFKVIGELLGLLKSNQDQRAGVAIQQAEDEKKSAEADARIAASEAQPVTDVKVEERLANGSF